MRDLDNLDKYLAPVAAVDDAVLASPGGVAAIADQIDQLRQACQLPNVRLGVVPALPAPTSQSATGYHLYDHRAVMVGTKTATAPRRR